MEQTTEEEKFGNARNRRNISTQHTTAKKAGYNPGCTSSKQRKNDRSTSIKNAKQEMLWKSKIEPA